MKSLLNVFWESDKAKTPVNDPPQQAGWTAMPAAAVASQGVSTPSVPIPQLGDPQMLEQLNAVITKRQTPFTALMESAASLAAFIPDESTRFKAAFAQISAGGQRSAASFAPAIDLHLSDIDAEARAFKTMLDKQISEKVDAIKTASAAQRSDGAFLRKRAEQLQVEAAAALQQASVADQKAQELDNQANIAQLEIDAVAKKFSSTVELVKQGLTSKRQYLSNIL